MNEYYSRRAGHSFEGVEVLRYKIVLPEISERQCISEFYKGIYDRVIAYCEGDLIKYAEQKYTDCDMPKKKFNYPPISYALVGKVTAEKDGLLFIKLVASVSQRGLSDTITVYDAHAWDLNEERLLPPKMAARSYFGGGSFRQLGKDGFLVENGKAFVCRKEGLSPLEIAKKE